LLATLHFLLDLLVVLEMEVLVVALVKEKEMLLLHLPLVVVQHMVVLLFLHLL
jgi:hypothetical protein